MSEFYQCVVIPTKDRSDLLLDRSLLSVANQSLRPDLVLIVNDGEDFDAQVIAGICECLEGQPFEIVTNVRTNGLSGALNSACSWLQAKGFNGFVALLDDDDDWEPNHLACNWKQAYALSADVVISGLKFICDGIERPRKLLDALDSDSFLVGNPGWQGSNTYVRFDTLLQAGCFREGLKSCNDRDLALRLLRLPKVRIAFTKQWTANWRQDSSRQTLSAARSEPKLLGLAGFFKIFEAEMSDRGREQFFKRAKEYFGFEEVEILEKSTSKMNFKLLNES
jgi:glycosyltransferase involved in cell wall biosynthesis